MPRHLPISLPRHGAEMVALICAPLVLAGQLPAQAADASPWANDMHSAARLIAGGPSHNDGHPVLRAGIEVRLDPGWKTYWRYPGDSGVPPRFAFTRSDNVQAITVEWPAPHRFRDEGGQSIGYKDHVIFPLAITPKNPQEPVTLRLDLDYAVCEKLCIPAVGKAELVIAGRQTAYDALLGAAEAHVPQRRNIGDASALSIRSVHRQSPTRVVVDVAAPEGAEVDLFAEGPTPDWALPLPEPEAGAPAGLKRFAFTLDGLPPGASAAGATLKLTAVSGDTATEAEVPLD